MRRIHWASALVYSGSGAMAALIPALFAARMHGHQLFGLARALVPGLTG